MKLFECANGVLINPNLVTRCYTSKSEGKNVAIFCFQDVKIQMTFDSKSYAEGEIKAFREHFDEG